MPSQEEYLDNLPNENIQRGIEGEDDLQDIQALLQKTDDDENIGEEIEALVQEISQKEERSAESRGTKRGQTGMPVLNGDEDRQVETGRKKADKKQQRAEKAAAKKAAKEEKAARKKAKSAKGKTAQTLPEEVPTDLEAGDRKLVSGTAAPQEEMEDGDELLFDTSVLDAIVSKAGLMDEKTIKEAARRGGQYQKEPDAVGIEERGDMSLEDGKEGVIPEDPSSQEQSGTQDLPGTKDTDSGGADDTDFPTVDSADADISEFPTIDLSQQDEADLEGIGEAEAENKGLFDKVMNLLTEDEEEGDQDGSVEDLDALSEEEDQKETGEDAKQKKDKKEKKAKKAKPKKDAKSKKPKKPKPKKPKKVTEKTPRKKIPLKKILPVVVLCVSIGIFILVVVRGSADYMDKQAARQAYERGDYRTCYQYLFDRKRNEAEEEMYVKAESILYIRLWLREYEMFVEEGDEVKALDSLIQTVVDYPGLYAYADRYSAGNEVYGEYTAVLNILSDKYGLSESQALEIAAESRDIVYTKMVTAIAGGASFQDWQEQARPSQPDLSEDSKEDEDLPDMLPEEEDLGQDDFVGRF